LEGKRISRNRKLEKHEVARKIENSENRENNKGTFAVYLILFFRN